LKYSSTPTLNGLRKKHLNTLKLSDFGNVSDVKK